MQRLLWQGTLGVLGILGLSLGPGAALADAGDDFLAARDAFRSGDQPRVAQYAQRLRGHPLQPYVQAWDLTMRLDRADPGEIRAFLNTQGDSFAGDRLRADWLKRLGLRREWTTFNTEYPLLISAPDTELTCYALQARLARRDGDPLADAKRLWFSSDALPPSCTPLFEALAAAGRLSPEEVWARVRLALEVGNTTTARNAAAWLTDGQGASLGDAVGRATDSPQRYLEHPSVGLDLRAGREAVAFALYRLARTQPDLAGSLWEERRARFPAAEQRYVWGQLALAGARRHHAPALEWFRRADGALSDAQQGWRVRLALRLRNWNEALTAIEAMSPVEQQQPAWRYWKARVFKQQGRTAAANALLAPLSVEHHYYGQLAKEELGESLSAPSVAYKPNADELAAARAVPGIQRALALYRLGLRLEATKEWNFALRGFNDRQLLAAAEVARREDWPDRAINTANKTVQLHDFGQRFPAPHYDVMTSYTRPLRLDEAWVYGLIRQESRFVREARSTVGAQGLMQVMPATGRWIARKMGLKSYRDAHLGELDTNISFGTFYLRHVLDEFDGQQAMATAAYNAGPGRARNWRGESALEGAVYAESIPFNETRDYVQKVLSNAIYYAASFGQGAQSLKQRLGTVPGRGTD